MGDAGAGRWRSRLRVPLVAACVYGGLWLLMDVAFIAHAFSLPFLGGAAFYRRYSHMVGGPVQYSANLFSQAYSRHWAGVLAFTLLALAAWAIARGVLRRFSPRTPAACDWPAAAFPLVLLILASRYLAVLFILPMLVGLAAAWLYMAIRERPLNGRAQPAVVILFLVASIPLYYLLASGFLYLCAMAALFELLVRKRARWGLAWIAFGAAVPYGISYVYYEPDIAGRYFRWMMLPRRDAITTGLVAAMYLFVPVGALVAFLIDRLGSRRERAREAATSTNGRQRRRPPTARAQATGIPDRPAPRLRLAARIVGFAALALLASRLVALRFDTSGWIYADYLLDEGRPDEALASLAQSPEDTDTIRFLTLHALARSGRLPWEMFHYPQIASSDALLLRDTAWDTVPVVAQWRSDLYLELGRVGESQRWAHEALSVGGETPRVLERMALVYVLNNDADAARTFLRALETVPFQAARARQYLAALDLDPGMGSDPLVARIRPLMLHKDYVGTWNTEQILHQCLDANPSNRMAFEYLLAHYLLTSDLKGLAGLAPRLKDFYRDLPTHVQEALVGIRNENGSLPPGIDASAISAAVESRFQTFLGMWSRYQNGAPKDAWNALAPDFGATFWFFYVFGRTAAGPPPDFRADAARATGGSQ